MGTFNDYINDLAIAGLPQGVRLGQQMFNVLHGMRPDIANALRGTDDDPFHQNERIPAFLQKVAELWETMVVHSIYVEQNYEEITLNCSCGGLYIDMGGSATVKEIMEAERKHLEEVGAGEPHRGTGDRLGTEWGEIVQDEERAVGESQPGR